MIFVDTGAWFALSVESDPDHAVATKFVTENREPLVTSDYVVGELLNLFVFRRQKEKGIRWISRVLNSDGVQLISIDTQQFNEACHVYTAFMDKAWSFTDCTSYVVMKHLSIRKAFSFDSHFRQFGTVDVVP
jgi:predicted nucleic acid-binding protein